MHRRCGIVAAPPSLPFGDGLRPAPDETVRRPRGARSDELFRLESATPSDTNDWVRQSQDSKVFTKIVNIRPSSRGRIEGETIWSAASTTPSLRRGKYAVTVNNKAKIQDLLSVVEAAYSVDLPAQQWTTGVLDAADRVFGNKLGGFACSFRATPNDTITIDRSSAAIVWQDPALISRIFDGLTQAPPGWLSGYLKDVRSAGRCLLTSEVDPQRKLSYRSELARTGVHDGINVCCLDLDREGFLLSLGIPSSIGFTAEVRDNLSKVATHILAARRLRKRLAGEAAAGNGAESASASAAVLAPDGALLDARGEAKMADARRALRTAVLDVERARTSLRDQPGPALAMWKGLVSARWSLVDEFDSHGSKYVVARENAPRPTGLVSLTPTERCVVTYASRGYSTKEIAYTLGISATTVRVLLMRAVRRCGVSGRDELLQLCRQSEGNTGS